MKPADFKESNITLTRPDAISDLECSSLKAWTDGQQCITLWKPSFKERISILIFGRVWLGVLSGNTQPPVFISEETVFAKASIKARLCAFATQAKESIIAMLKSVKDGFKKVIHS